MQLEVALPTGGCCKQLMNESDSMFTSGLQQFQHELEKQRQKTDRAEGEHATSVFTGGAKNETEISFLHKNKMFLLFFVSVFFDSLFYFIYTREIYPFLY